MKRLYYEQNTGQVQGAMHTREEVACGSAGEVKKVPEYPSA
jgi:hypothetical protein